MFKKLIFAAVLLVPLVFGQSERGSLTGVVLDASGAAIANVPVAITNRATHVLKLSTVYDLPFGKSQRWTTHGIAGQALGDGG